MHAHMRGEVKRAGTRFDPVPVPVPGQLYFTWKIHVRINLLFLLSNLTCDYILRQGYVKTGIRMIGTNCSPWQVQSRPMFQGGSKVTRVNQDLIILYGNVGRIFGNAINLG